MKKITIFLIFYIAVLTHLYGQQSKVLSVHINDSGKYCMVLSNSAMSDTIARYYFKVTLLDYLITSDTSIAYLLEAPMHYSYDKFDKINNKWVYSDYSGILARNNKDTYIPKGMSKREVSDLKIVMQDIVSYKIDGQPLIKNCQDFREMNIYLKKTNRLTVDTTQNSPKK